MKKTLTISVLALTLAGLGAAASYAQQGSAPVNDAASVKESHWRGDGEGNWREGRRGGGERFGREGRHGGRHEGRGRGEGRGHGGGRHGGHMMQQLQAFDANGDGTVTQAEIDQFRQGQIASFDANRDGTLALDEYQALWLDQMRERMVDAFQEHDADGDGQVTAEEFNKRFTGLVERFDRNGDGQLSADDRGGRRFNRQNAPAQPDAAPGPQATPGVEAPAAPAPQQ